MTMRSAMSMNMVWGMSSRNWLIRRTYSLHSASATPDSIAARGPWSRITIDTVAATQPAPARTSGSRSTQRASPSTRTKAACTQNHSGGLLK